MRTALSLAGLPALVGCTSVRVQEFPALGPMEGCYEDAWLDGVACGRVVSVSGPGELASALASASPSDCIDVVEGGYAGFEIPAGVRVLGRGADCVTIAGAVSISPGQGAMLRGVTLAGGGIAADGEPVEASVEHVRISGSTESGIEVLEASSITVVHTLIEGAARYGIAAWSADLTLQRSIVRSGAGPGLWAGCRGESHHTICPTSAVLVEDVEVVDNATVGVYLDAAVARIDGLTLRGTRIGPNFSFGCGLVLGEGAVLSARTITIADNADVGFLLCDATADVDDLEVSGNLRGLYVTDDSSARIEHALVSGNLIVGVVVTPSARALIHHAIIRDTELAATPVIIDGVSAGIADVGDGIDWCEGASLDLAHVTVSASPRQSILVDRAVGPGSRLEDITLTGGDEAKGIVVQGATAPPPIDVGEGVPAIQVVADEPHRMGCGSMVVDG